MAVAPPHRVGFHELRRATRQSTPRALDPASRIARAEMSTMAMLGLGATRAGAFAPEPIPRRRASPYRRAQISRAVAPRAAVALAAPGLSPFVRPRASVFIAGASSRRERPPTRSRCLPRTRATRTASPTTPRTPPWTRRRSPPPPTSSRSLSSSPSPPWPSGCAVPSSPWSTPPSSASSPPSSSPPCPRRGVHRLPVLHRVRVLRRPHHHARRGGPTSRLARRGTRRRFRRCPRRLRQRRHRRRRRRARRRGALAAAPATISAFAGPASAAVVPYALSYALIRCLAIPAAVITSSAQAAFLACKSPWQPLTSVGLAGVVNLIFDVVLVVGLGAGIRGAAVATAGSQICMASVLLIALLREGRRRRAAAAEKAARAAELAEEAGGAREKALRGWTRRRQPSLP